MQPDSQRETNSEIPRETNSSKIPRETNSRKINNQLYFYITKAAICQVDVEEGDDDVSMSSERPSRTELDSHANMPVVGKHAYIISDSGKVADVSPFTPDYNSMEIPIVDAAIQYDCPYTDKRYILVIRNALHVPSMSNNLIPPFMTREMGTTHPKYMWQNQLLKITRYISRKQDSGFNYRSGASSLALKQQSHHQVLSVNVTMCTS